MDIIVRIKNLFKKKIRFKYTNEDRMDITDPDWRSEVARDRSYGKIGLVILGMVVVIVVIILGVHELDISCNILHCTRFELLLRIYYHIFPHVPLPGKDLVK